MHTRSLIAGFVCLLFSSVCAQPTDSLTSATPLSLSGYAEAYYAYDFNHPNDNKRPPFVYSFNRNNEVNINLAYLKAAYAANRLRANLALMTGTYANANLASEPGVLKNIYEAYIGYKLLKSGDLWVDAGVMPSHIGFESVAGQDCRTLTRSIVAENTPYYESGVKLGYATKSKEWYVAALLLNGWQRIQRPDGYTQLAAGTQVTYTPGTRVSINHSTFYGNRGPDSISQFCFYQDFYTILKLSKKWEFIIGFDYGLEQYPVDNSRWSKWWSPVLIAYFRPSAANGIGVRAEYFHDPDDILISIRSPNGLQVFGYSVNYDRYLYKNVLWRIEGKVFNSIDAVFTRHSGRGTNVSPVITTSLSLAF